MLRLYKPVATDEIFTLHKIIEHLVIDVWCKADIKTCSSKMNSELKNIIGYSYKPKVTFGKEIIKIYLQFKDINQADRDKISEAFKQSNQIEDLCEKRITPIYLSDLNKVVENEIKPLLKWCYEDLLDKKKVGGDKLTYYKTLNGSNNFNYCPCCGLIDFEGDEPENMVREANDHYLPKSKYPFASVSFQNLVPLCYKCNSDRKKTKDPIEGSRKAYYPFSKTPQNHSIDITTTFDLVLDAENIPIFENVLITLGGDSDKSETWEWLFQVKSRYSTKIKRHSKTFLRDLKSRYRIKLKSNPDATIEEVLNEEIELFNDDLFDDWKFLKVPVIKQLLITKEYIDIYK